MMKKNPMHKFFFTLFLFMLGIQVYSQDKLTNQDVKALYKDMQGFYSSALQAANDSAYFDIRLKMVPIWKNREGFWLYVEQAMFGSEDKPYRQRVYHLSLLNDSTIESRVYTIKNGEQYYGDWQKWKPLQELPMDSLELRKGCSIFLHKKGNHLYAGSTHANDCESNLRGATYASSEVTINRDMLKSWDRGFDKEGKQVWGAVKGPYEFIKIDN